VSYNISIRIDIGLWNRLTNTILLLSFQFIINYLNFQVVGWVRNGETMLAATFTFPSSLQEAEQMKNDHEKLKKALEVRGMIYFILLSKAILMDVAWR